METLALKHDLLWYDLELCTVSFTWYSSFSSSQHSQQKKKAEWIVHPCVHPSAPTLMRFPAGGLRQPSSVHQGRLSVGGCTTWSVTHLKHPAGVENWCLWRPCCEKSIHLSSCWLTSVNGRSQGTGLALVIHLWTAWSGRPSQGTTWLESPQSSSTMSGEKHWLPGWLVAPWQAEVLSVNTQV